MRTFILTFFVSLFSFFPALSQCTIDPYIQDNYETDAWTLFFREFANDPTHPDYDTPILNSNKIVPYLEKLSAVYNLIDTNIVADSLFNKFNIHSNQAFASNNGFENHIAFGEIYFEISEDIPWVSDFIDTGISGVPELDQLMADYQFTITNVGIVEPPPFYLFTINSSIPYLNHFALLDDFDSIEGISLVMPGYVNSNNYNGISYEIDGEEVQASNIVSTNDGLLFSLHTGDCFFGCPISKGWEVTISEDCTKISIEEMEILGIEHATENTLRIYPNPAEEYLYIETEAISNYEINIISLQGILLKNSTNSTQINISSLPTGIYFIEFISDEGISQIKKFLKK
ncbi:T9SS type A sorting domain-containing protein [Marinirhabdus gelatinilytica]|nr:T9SS type A sorting domain-containing protein [Marinirhabdus gelatinilytica]